MLLLNGRFDLGDVFHTVQCAASMSTCSLRVSQLCQTPISDSHNVCILFFLQLQPLPRHLHSLPNKGWPVRSSDLWTWSVYNILALSSLANVIMTKLSSPVAVAKYVFFPRFFCPSCLSWAMMSPAIPVLTSRWRQCSCYRNLIGLNSLSGAAFCKIKHFHNVWLICIIFLY